MGKGYCVDAGRGVYYREHALFDYGGCNVRKVHLVAQRQDQNGSKRAEEMFRDVSREDTAAMTYSWKHLSG